MASIMLGNVLSLCALFIAAVCSKWRGHYEQVHECILHMWPSCVHSPDVSYIAQVYRGLQSDSVCVPSLDELSIAAIYSRWGGLHSDTVGYMCHVAAVQSNERHPDVHCQNELHLAAV